MIGQGEKPLGEKRLYKEHPEKYFSFVKTVMVDGIPYDIDVDILAGMYSGTQSRRRCHKKIKEGVNCKECKNRSYKPIAKYDILNHLQGNVYNASDVIGVYIKHRCMNRYNDDYLLSICLIFQSMIVKSLVECKALVRLMSLLICFMNKRC